MGKGLLEPQVSLQWSSKGACNNIGESPSRSLKTRLDDVEQSWTDELPLKSCDGDSRMSRKVPVGSRNIGPTPTYDLILSSP